MQLYFHLIKQVKKLLKKPDSSMRPYILMVMQCIIHIKHLMIEIVINYKADRFVFESIGFNHPYEK